MSAKDEEDGAVRPAGPEFAEPIATTTSRRSNSEPSDNERGSLLLKNSSIVAATHADGGFPEENTCVPMFSKTFHVETIRLVGSINLFMLFFVGMIITETYVVRSIPPDSTVVYNLFGFNHACNWVDHNPARMVAAIIVPFAQIPFILYIFFFHVRLSFRVKEGKISKWILWYSRIVSPYNAFAFAMLHLWFVNTPEEGYGFTAHYIPYAMFQIALGFMAILQALYLRATDNLPSRCIKGWMAMVYVFFLIGLTIVSLVGVCGIISENPIIDSKNNANHQTAFRLISYVYAFCVLILPILWSVIERRNGDVQTIAFG